MFERGKSTGRSLTLGRIYSPYISDEQISVMKEIATVHPDLIFCGSLGLVINDLLERNVKDIDILTPEDSYKGPPGNFLNKYRKSTNANFHIFMNGKNRVSCFSVFMGKNRDIKVDVLYNEKKATAEYEIVRLDSSLTIKVEKPNGAINAKLGYIQHIKSADSLAKHLKDLYSMEVDNQLIMESLDKRSIYDKQKQKRVGVINYNL